MVTITFQTTLRRSLGVHTMQVERPGATVGEVLAQCEEALGQPVLPHLTNAQGELLRGVMILVNGKNVLLLQGLATTVKAEDEVVVFPPAGGG